LIDTIKDLGVIFDPELNFSQHCKERNKQSLRNVGDY